MLKTGRVWNHARSGKPAHERQRPAAEPLELVLLRAPRRDRPGDRARDRTGNRPPARRDRAHRLGKHRVPRGARGAGLGDDQQIRGGLSRPALLRRLPVRRHRRTARDRARLHPVRLPLRQRAAEFRQPGEPGRVHGADAAGRHVHGPRPRRRRPSDPRLAGQHVGPLVQAGLLRRRPPHPSHRHGSGRGAGEGAQAEAHHRRRLRLCAPLGLRTLPRDLRRGRRLFRRRHRPFRRPGGGRRASLAVPARPCRHDHHAQDPARPARRHDPDQRRGSRQKDQLGDLPRPAGRPADACHRRQGGGVPRGADARVQGLRACRGRQRQGDGRADPRGRLQAGDRRHRQSPDAGRPDARRG